MDAPVETVWIAEDEDPDVTFVWTGRFSGHLDAGGRVAEEFQDLPADEAIAWGRKRCSVVLVRPGDQDYFSAGERNPDPDEFPPWPPQNLQLERRRVRGFEALDNTRSGAPVLWDVRISAHRGRLRASPFRRAIRDHPATRDVQAPAPGYPPASAAFLIEASTHAHAEAIATGIADLAFSALPARDPLADTTIRQVRAGLAIEVYPHRPTHPVRGPGVTYGG